MPIFRTISGQTLLAWETLLQKIILKQYIKPDRIFGTAFA
jgi:hypothetical protein